MRIKNFNDLELEYLDVEDLYAIELKAKGLSFPECLDYLCIPVEDVPAADLAIAKRIHLRGRNYAINSAADKLFSAMDMRGGGQVALDYLSQMSSTFGLEGKIDAGTKSGFTFNVVMPEDTPAE